jgi:beta-lactamase class A
MPPADHSATLRSRIDAILRSFCGDDPGRSVAFRGYRPELALQSVRGEVARPAASVMKIALAMAVFDGARRGAIDLEQHVAVRSFTATRYVSILAGFDPGHMLTVREICRLALITSDNPLAVFLQGLAGFDAVNRLLAEAGCRPPSEMAAGFSEDELGPKNRASVFTAEAVLRLIDVLRSDPHYADLVLALKNNLRNNRIPALLPEHVTVIHKTGSLEGVANDAGLVEDGQVEFAVAFLSDHQADTARASSDTAACSLALYELLGAH